jgi:hypothetical protein
MSTVSMTFTINLQRGLYNMKSIYYTLIKRQTKGEDMKAIRMRAHIKAMSNTIEICIIASIIALVADAGWVIHDVIDNGLSIWYILIETGLVIAALMTTYALIKHHNDQIENGFKMLLSKKIAEQRARNRCKRHLELVRSK